MVLITYTLALIVAAISLAQIWRRRKKIEELERTNKCLNSLIHEFFKEGYKRVRYVNEDSEGRLISDVTYCIYVDIGVDHMELKKAYNQAGIKLENDNKKDDNE